MKRQVISAALSILVLTLLTGILYPLAVTGIAAVVFPAQASGSLLRAGGGPAGSALIGQPFSSPAYFWGRPSATAPFAYNAALSTGSNLGPDEPRPPGRREGAGRGPAGRRPREHEPVPVDLVTSSASGLDPDISPAAAYYQVHRVAKARGFGEEKVRGLVAAHIKGRTWGCLGEPRVNVLELNLALDGR